MSDKWGAYNDIERLLDGNGDSMNYVHHLVNHKEGFVNFDKPLIHTQTIKRHWKDIKEVIKRRRVSKKVEQHLYRYRLIKKYPVKTLHHLMVEAGKSFFYSRFTHL